MKVERDIVVTNEHGLHARPAMQLVDLANRFQSDVAIRKLPVGEAGEGSTRGAADLAGEAVDAKSVMQVITLAAVRGTRLRLIADGPDAPEAAQAVARLFEENFGEDE